MHGVLRLALGFGIMPLEFIQFVLPLLGASTAVQWEQNLQRRCVGAALPLLCPRRLRQGQVFNDKNEEDYIRYFKASCGFADLINNKTRCQFKVKETVAR